jgi:hypothetical protein
MITLCIFMKGIFLRNLLKKLIKIKWKISSKCLKTGSVIIPKFNTNLYSVARIIVFKIEKNLYILSYCTETILSTDEWRQCHNILQRQQFRLYKNDLF